MVGLENGISLGGVGIVGLWPWSDWVLSLFALSKVVRQQFVGDVGTFILFFWC